MQRRPNGTVVGAIWLAGESPGQGFPETEWSDFPVAVLGSWLPALQRLRVRGDSAECHFLDGPYHFTVSVATPREWRVACFERRQGPSAMNAIHEWNDVPGELVESAIAAARAILGYCDSRGWWDADTDRLRAALSVIDRDAAS